MLNKVGREIGPHLRRGQLVLSVLAGATTAALTGILGHDQVVRSMPNTPARLGKGMTVWYATPETTETQRAQAAALLGALGLQLEVDDEKMVAMATAVSGTGPTYVFLVMEALIDAAVHLGFPRHVAHDLVIETLEGSTLFAKQSGHAPGRAAQHGHDARAARRPRRCTSSRAGACGPCCREAVWAAFRRTVELGDQLEASLEVPGQGRPRRPMTPPAATSRVDLRRAPLTDAPRPRPAGRGPRLLGGRSGHVGSIPGHVGRPRRRRLAPPRCGAVRRGRARLVARRAHRPRRGLAGARLRLHPGGAPDRPLAVGRRLRRRRFRSLQRTPSSAVDDDVGRGHRRAPDRGSSPPAGRGEAACRSPRSAATMPGAGCISSSTATTSITWPSSSRGPTRFASARSTATRSSPIRGHRTTPASGPRSGTIQRAVRRPRPDRARRTLDRGGRDARLDAARSRRPPRRLGDGGRRAPSRSSTRRGTWLPTRRRASTPGTTATSSPPATKRRRPPSPATTKPAPPCWPPRHPGDRGPALAGRLELGLRLPIRARPQAPRHAGALVRRGRLAGSLMPTDRTPGAATGAAGLTIEGIVAVESPREFRVHPARTDRRVHRRDVAGARQLFTLSLRGTGAPATQLTASEKPSAIRSGRQTADASPSSATTRSGSSRPTARDSPGSSPSPAAAASRAGRPTAGASRSSRAGVAGRRSGSSMRRSRAAAARSATRAHRRPRP